jgi:AcrR family transcriptional regulator
VADDDATNVIRRPRADAERNRVRLLEAAKAIFAEKGSAASLDGIARAAGLGAGTLYRHFPTRDALIAAAYRSESQQLAAAANRLSETYPPLTALREWLRSFVDYIATKRGMSELLNSMAGGTSELYSASTAETQRSIGMLVDKAVESGDIVLEIDPLDLLRALASVVNTSSAAEPQHAAKRLIDILIAGIRTRT